MRLSREQLRRRTRYRQAVDYSDAPINYDAAGLMAVIDVMPKRLRDEINERGLEQDIYDGLPYEWQIRIGEAMSPGSSGGMTQADLDDIWSD